MEIAVVQEWWARFGGSELVATEIASQFRNRDLWALYFDKNVPEKDRQILSLHESWLNKIPWHENRYLATAFAPLVFRTLSLKKYDLVISSSHTFAHTVKFPDSRNTIYLSYIHTPNRVVWTPSIDNRGKESLPFANKYLRGIDRTLGNHVLGFAANSNEVARRIEKYWGRDSTVIHPPVDIFHSDPSNIEEGKLPFKQGTYFVSAGRFVNYKNHMTAMKIASIAKMPLVIMCAGPTDRTLREEAELLKIHIHFEIAPSRSRWLFLLANAKSMLFPTHEDFGITPIESISLGVPVCALAKGGALDYIKDGVNGWLVEELNPFAFVEAMHREIRSSKQEIKDSVNHFSKLRFREEIRSWIDNYIDVKRSLS